MTLAITATIVVLLLLVCFSKHRLAVRIRGVARRKSEDVTDNIGLGKDEHSERIRDAKSSLVDFKRQIAQFTASNKKLERDHESEVANAEKFARLVDAAVEAGNEENVGKCLTLQEAAENKAISISLQLKKSLKQLEALQKQSNERGDEIEGYESNAALLAAKEASLNMRTNMANASTAFGGKGSLGDLGAYEAKLQEEEDVLDAMDGMDNSTADDMEALYGDGGSVELSDKVKALMDKAKAAKAVDAYPNKQDLEKDVN